MDKSHGVTITSAGLWSIMMTIVPKVLMGNMAVRRKEDAGDDCKTKDIVLQGLSWDHVPRRLRSNLCGKCQYLQLSVELIILRIQL